MKLLPMIATTTLSLLLGTALVACAQQADDRTASPGTSASVPSAGSPAPSPAATSAGAAPSTGPWTSAPKPSPTSPPDAAIVFDGDSLTAGLMLPEAESYPAQLMAILPPSISWVNVAVSGQIWPQLLADAGTDVDDRYDDRRAVNVVVVWAAANDLASGFSAQDIFDNARRYCEERRQRGFRVVVLTMYPLQPKDVDAEYDQVRREYNELLRAGWPDFADGLVDVAADERIGDDSGPERSAYFLDLVHLTAAGYWVIADCVRPVLLGLLER
jgi:lysophospholipase L1-like esterase